ncbi:MAG: PspC domain-containing protein [Parcubacteria group bacterium]|nr:PspC domain-containing protein [Parcubacteria group bacterium]
MKKLYRSSENKVFAGVCGGIGEYASVDPVILRVLWVIITIFTGVAPGIVVYILAIFIIPPHRGPKIHEHECGSCKKDDDEDDD